MEWRVRAKAQSAEVKAAQASERDAVIAACRALKKRNRQRSAGR